MAGLIVKVYTFMLFSAYNGALWAENEWGYVTFTPLGQFLAEKKPRYSYAIMYFVFHELLVIPEIYHFGLSRICISNMWLGLQK